MASDRSITRPTKRPKTEGDMNLPIDILGRILRYLPRLGDRLRFRAVCRSWGLAEREHPPPPQLPWLFLPHREASSVHGFFSPSDDAVYRLPLPEDARGARCFGSFEGWMFVADRDSRQLMCINPFLKSRISLPKRISIQFPDDNPPRRSYLNLTFSRHYGEPDWSTCLLYKAISSTSPASPGCLVAAIDDVNIVLCLCHPGSSNSWTTHCDFSFLISDIIFHQGKLLALTRLEELVVFTVGDGDGGEPVVVGTEKWDIAQRANTWGNPYERSSRCIYLVESSCGGKLWMVERRWLLDEVARTYAFKVYELDRSTRPFRWLEVGSLGDQILFVGGKCSKSLVASEFDGRPADCIYFADEAFDLNGYVNPCHDSGVYSLRDGSITPFFPTRSATRRPNWLFLDKNSIVL